MFETLEAPRSDSLLSLIKQYNDDPRPGKVDLGVGVFRDETGKTPVMQAVKAAERLMVEQQPSKSYLGLEGDPQFVALLRPIVFGDRDNLGERVVGIQTPGGSGALRVAAELVKLSRPGARIWVGMPTWPNHVPVLAAAGLPIAEYPYFDIRMQSILFEAMVAALSRAPAGDAVLLHGCCHNPTGADLSLAQWETIARIVAERQLLPFIDLAYQGLGDGLDPDASGTRLVIQAVPEALVSYSCDKNFGLYRDRTGALFGIASNGEMAGNLLGAMGTFARVMWSMPPDHGAAVVRLILESKELSDIWRRELEGMCARVNGVRGALANANQALLFLADQKGLFSNLSIAGERITRLREKFGVYMAPSGRINLAGLRTRDVPKLVDALHDVGYFA